MPATMSIVRRRGPALAPAGPAVFRQGALQIHSEPGGWVVVIVGRARADVDRDGSISLCLVDDGADTAHLADSVLLVVARALIERHDGWFHVHAGLVTDDTGSATLIVGESGAGKTTTTLALAARQHLLTDDVVFVQCRGQDVVARGLLRPLHVGVATLEMFPELRASVLPGLSSAGKAVVGVDDAGGAGAVVVVGRLVFPSIHQAPLTTAEGMSPSLVLPLLLHGSAMVAWPGLPLGAEHLHCLGKLARLPGCALRIGGDALVEPRCIAAAVESVLGVKGPVPEPRRK